MSISTQRKYQVLLGPHTTEKSITGADKLQQVSFKVATDANKFEIKEAVESLFNVAVDKVRVVNMKGKTRNFRKVAGRTKAWKKAIVCLKYGHDINFAEYE